MKFRIFFAALLGLSLVIVIGIYRQSHRGGESPVIQAIQESPAPSVGQGTSVAGQPALRAGHRTLPVRGDWPAFRERFGSELLPTFSEDGRLVSLRGQFSKGTKAEDFRTDQEDKVIARAREVLSAAKSLLGVEAEAPLGSPRYRGDALSAQVSFQESVEGTAVAPYGTVTVSLGAEGELLGIDSTYVTKPRIENSGTLTEEEALVRAASALPPEEGALKADSGRRVLWAAYPKPAPGGSGTPVRLAYEVLLRGFQVIIDASDGRILVRRDRRNFRHSLL